MENTPEHSDSVASDSLELKFVAPPETDDRELSTKFHQFGVEIDASDHRTYLEIAKGLGMVAADTVYRSREAAVRLSQLRDKLLRKDRQTEEK